MRPMKLLGLVIVLATAMFTCSMLVSTAHAQMACGQHEVVTKRLTDSYGEKRVGIGLAGETTAFELYANETTGTWTVLRTDTSGTSCVMAVGRDWQADEPPPKGDPT